MTTKAQKLDIEKRRADARAYLRALLKPGAPVYCVLRSVASSGMSRRITLLAAVASADGSPGIENITFDVARATGMRLNRDGSLVVGGCGMDMGFHVVYGLGRALYPAGFGLPGTNKDGDRVLRPETPDAAAALVKAGVKFRGRNGDPSGWDNDGGYALQRVWL